MGMRLITIIKVQAAVNHGRKLSFGHKIEMFVTFDIVLRSSSVLPFQKWQSVHMIIGYGTSADHGHCSQAAAADWGEKLTF
jgi:hypothetical protein